MKSAIVTGANGFIGSAVVRKLLDEKIRVFAIVHNGNTCNLPNHPLLSIVSCDLNKYKELNTLIDKDNYDYFFHFAWNGSAGDARSDYELQLNNVKNSLDAIVVAKQLGCSRFIAAGSIIEHESIAATYTDKNRPGVNYIYGSAKTTFHLMGAPLAAKIGIELIWGNITNAYGVGELSPRLVNTTIRKCINGITPEFTSGTQRYDFIYIDDIANAFFLIATKGVPFRSYTLGSSNSKPLKSFLIEMQNAIAPDIEFKFGDIPFTGVDLPEECFDCTNLQKDTGFVATISFSEGCKKTYQWLKEVMDEQSL